MYASTWDDSWQSYGLFPYVDEWYEEAIDISTNKWKLIGGATAALVLCTASAFGTSQIMTSIAKAEQQAKTAFVDSVLGGSRTYEQQKTASGITDGKNAYLAKLAQEQAAKEAAARASAQAQAAHPSQPTQHALASRGDTGYTQQVSAAASDVEWLARLVHAEAGNQPFDGKVAVANVVLNRVKSHQFPSTIQAVIFQKGQFQPVANGRIYNTPTQEDYAAVNAALNGRNVVGNALYFQNTSITGQNWMTANRQFVVRIGDHSFYR